MSHKQRGRVESTPSAEKRRSRAVEPEYGITEIREIRAPGTSAFTKCAGETRRIFGEWTRMLRARMNEIAGFSATFWESLVARAGAVKRNVPSWAANERVRAMELQVRPCPTVDREQLLVRINAADKPADIRWCDYVRLKNKANRMTVVCRLHSDDIPEIKNRRRGVLYMSEHLMARVEAESGGPLEFTIVKASRWLVWDYFIQYHPSDAVRVGTWLGIIAVIISLVGLLMGIIAFVR